MNGWLSKKFQSQFKSNEISKQALGKLKQLESKNYTHNADTQTLGETSSLCRNCSMVSSGLNNTISVTLNKDLLANTQLGDLTTVEELTSDPGFQEFLSSQLELYYKFITNASTSNLLSKAKERALGHESESLGITVPAHESRTCHGQVRGSSRTFQLAAGRKDNLNNDVNLSLIEEEDLRRATEDWARNGCEAQNIERQRSVSSDKAMNQSPMKSRFSEQTQRSRERQEADASVIPGSSIMETGHAIMKSRSSRQTQRCEEKGNADTSVIRRSSRQAQRSQEREQVASAVIQQSSSTDIRQSRAARKLSPQKPVPTDEAKMNVSTRKTSHSTKPSNVNVTDNHNQLTTLPTTRKRGQTSGVNETEPQQSDDDVFKVPLPPKPKTLRSRSKDKHSDNETKGKEGQRSDVSSRRNDGNVFKVPLPVKPKSARPQAMDTDTTVSWRRTGRVSKPPGSYWDPTQDKRQPDSRSFADRKVDRTSSKNGSPVPLKDRRIETAAAKMSKTAVKRPADIPLSEIDSESGYSSVGAPGHAGKVSRVEAVKEPGKRQDMSKSLDAVRGKQRHPQNVEPAEELEETLPADLVEEEPPKRSVKSTKVKPTEIEKPSSKQLHKEAQAELPRRGGRQFKDVEPPSSKEVMQGRKNTYSESESDKTDNEEEPPRRVTVKPTETERPSSKQNHKEAQAQPSRRAGRQFKDVENPSSKEVMQGRKNIFSGSDSDETNNEEEPPRRVAQSVKGKPTEIERPSSKRHHKEAQAELARKGGRQFKYVEHPSSKEMVQGRKKMYSESDSEETNDESFLISNKNTYYDQSRRREMTAAHNRNYAPGGISIVESSSDEEEVVGRRIRGGPPKKADPPQMKKKNEADTFKDRNNVEGGISLVDSSSDEEEEVGRRARGPPKKADPLQMKKNDADTFKDRNNVKGGISIVESSSDEEEVVGRRIRGPPKKANPRQMKKKIDADTFERSGLPAKSHNVKSKPDGQADTNSSPLATRPMRKRQVKARYIFAGSSTSDDDSVCASDNGNRYNRNQESGSFVDDASFVSSVRSNRGREMATARRPAVINRNAEDNRRPQLVSRFRC